MIINSSESVKSKIITSTNQLFDAMLATLKNNMTLVWQNPDELTPQQVLDAFGTDGGEMIRLANVLVTAINSTTPNTVAVDPPIPLTIADNGTVTVG